MVPANPSRTENSVSMTSSVEILPLRDSTVNVVVVDPSTLVSTSTRPGSGSASGGARDAVKSVYGGADGMLIMSGQLYLHPGLQRVGPRFSVRPPLRPFAATAAPSTTAARYASAARPPAVARCGSCGHADRVFLPRGIDVHFSGIASPVLSPRIFRGCFALPRLTLLRRRRP